MLALGSAGRDSCGGGAGRDSRWGAGLDSCGAGAGLCSRAGGSGRDSLLGLSICGAGRDSFLGLSICGSGRGSVLGLSVGGAGRGSLRRSGAGRLSSGGGIGRDSLRGRSAGLDSGYRFGSVLVSGARLPGSDRVSGRAGAGVTSPLPG
ncbi:MAG TPA: hypothetical protein VL135_13965 [Terracidiphilus sp.]|nr:hypothetical protein [Terracidiphilus sp.]